MKYLIKNKYWNIVEDYDISVLLFVLIDRPTKINKIKSLNIYTWNNKIQNSHREYDLPSYIEEDKNECAFFWDYNGRHYRKNNKPNFISFEGCHFQP